MNRSLASTEAKPTVVEFLDMTDSEIRELLKNVPKTFREFSSLDEHMNARYGQPGSEIRKRFLGKAQVFLANGIFESSAITVDPEILGGTPVFSGTRVTIQNLIDHLKTEELVESFLEDFDGVTKLQVMRVVRRIILFPD
ncbi:DUF433 domain-containing protein [Dyadobacter arcticus]|uniref:DUF433 domain-containing protein n=1 Tax=Dyadobacter arcticus TaxID=1078754 RepID=UPI001E3CEDA2|nr:DUF433 domain-containing protein [Dyadobacter arcticus]